MEISILTYLYHVEAKLTLATKLLVIKFETTKNLMVESSYGEQKNSNSGLFSLVSK